MWKARLVVIVILVLIGSTVSDVLQGQTSISSPYSAFGIGNLSDVSNNRARSMGGLGIGIRDNFTINLANPASYSGFDSTSFIFEGGASGHYVTLKTDDINESYSNATLTHLLFGFPVTKWWKSSFGMLPYSVMGYDATDFTHLDDIGNTEYIFQGSGGITRAFWGNSIQPAKFISFGVNTSYLFGTTERIRKVTFPDSSNLISSLTSSSISVNDLYFDFGTQLHFKLDSLKNLNLVIGGMYAPQQEIKARGNAMINSYLGDLSGVPLIIDTISMVQDEPGNLIIPTKYGIGVSIERKNRWFAGAEYEFGKWEDYSSFGANDSLTNTHSFKLGTQFTPNPNSFSYIQRVEYRVGGYFKQTYLNLRNEQINGIGITFGLGLPVKTNMLRRTRSMVNLGVEVGRRGTTTNGLIQENFVNFHIGISIYEWWFFKRRYK